MFLISLAKSLPRRASITAFLCLVVAHLEWPDMVVPSSALRSGWRRSRPMRRWRSSRRSVVLADEVHEQLVDPRVAGHLGVERRGEEVTLADRDDLTGGVPRRLSLGDPRHHLDPRSDLLHPRRPDEQRVERPVEGSYVDVALEGVDLPTERVAAHDDVEAADGLLAGDAVLDPVGEHDHPGAGAEHRHAVLGSLAQRLEEGEDPGQLCHRRGLPARDHDAVDLGELLGTAYRPGVGAELAQHRQVLADVALQGEYADP